MYLYHDDVTDNIFQSADKLTFILSSRAVDHTDKGDWMPTHECPNCHRPDDLFDR